MNHREIVSFVWGVADLIRDTFKRGNYQDVILPLTSSGGSTACWRRPKQKVLEANAKLNMGKSTCGARWAQLSGDVGA